jgi:outer membrane protein OmpA-like peptidoglycan-associated protein
MKFRAVLATATCLALPVLAQAQPVTGPYVNIEAGTSIEYSTNASLFLPGFPSGEFEKFQTKNQYRPSYAGVGGVGYGFGNGFRVELDGDYIRNTRKSADLSVAYDFGNGDSGDQDAGRIRAPGGEDKYGPMANILYDFSVGLPVYPYVGAGVGYQWVKLDSDFKVPGFGGFLTTGGTKGSFAYDVIAGLSYPLPMMPQLSLTAEYRFMQLTASRNYNLNVAGEGSTGLKVKFGQESSNTFLVGLRYQLFAPPPQAPATPAPMASPAPAAAKTYLVFFDWDKYSLTPRATQIIAEAASDSKTTATTTINVSGYTDTSGTPTYNQGLSERRAKAVAAKLVSDGVPASEISIHAYGETHLLVPTGPGVREPQNRRVEIVLD